jgi:hypothetical protein
LSGDPPLLEGEATSRDAATPFDLAWWTGHIPWLATIALFLLMLMKVVAVSHFSAATALAVVQFSGVGSVVLGSLVTTFPSLLVVLLWPLGWAIVFSSHSTAERAAFGAVFAFIAAAAVLFGIWWLSVPVVFFWTDFVLRGPLRRWVTRRIQSSVSKDSDFGLDQIQQELDQIQQEQDLIKARPDAQDALERLTKLHADIAAAKRRVSDGRQHYVRLDRQSNAFLIFVIVLTALQPLLVAIWPDPWMPSESVSFRDGTVEVGYFLANDSGSLVLLTEDRHVEFHLESTVASQAICSLHGRSAFSSFSVSLMDALLPGPTYPPCHG